MRKMDPPLTQLASVIRDFMHFYAQGIAPIVIKQIRVFILIDLFSDCK